MANKELFPFDILFYFANDFKTMVMLKKSTFAIVAILFAISACSTVSESYTLTGEVTGAPDGTIVEIIPTATHQDKKPVASAEIIGGKFVIKGSVEYPTACLLHIGENGYHTFMLENSGINVIADLNEQGYYNSIEVKGSKSDEIFRQKMAFRDTLNEMHLKYNQDYSDALAKANAESDEEKAAKIREEAYKALVKAEGEFFDKVEESMMRNFRANTDDFWGPLLILHNMNYIVEGDTTYVNLYNSFSDKAKNSFYGECLKSQLYPPTLVGKQVPEMTGMDKNGVKLSLKELCQGKKYVIIDFWASWCGPCRKSIPALKEFYAKYAPKGVEIVGVSIDKREADWKKALEQEQLPWPNILDTEGVNSSLFLVKAVPTMYVVDENGVVQSKNFYDADERAKWCAIFDKL